MPTDRLEGREQDATLKGSVKMHILKPSPGASVDLSHQPTIPMSNYRFGSWQVAISRHPRTAQDLTDQYDAASRKWQKVARRYGLDAAYRRPLLASGMGAILEQAGPAARVLDCGIGNGALAVALQRSFPKTPAFCGIDLSPEMLVRADAELRQAGVTPELKRADVLSIPYADASFDVVMAAHVLEHLAEPQRALKEMVRVLKPGGMLFVCLVRRSGFGALIQMRWRTWAVTEQQGLAWLKACHLEHPEFQTIRLGSCAGHASTAFWARRQGEAAHAPEPGTATALEGVLS
ncbi:MAG: methyltransferase domain-containing protein [Paracoccaceae bacterium]|nr:methyltransferase domain-containing protein [Paracoccaceae bacterium]